MGGKIYEFMEMWLKCGTCGFIGRWRFRPGYDMRCGLLGDGDSALIVISHGLWLIHLCYAWDAKVVWRVPPPRSISAMPWDAEDSMTCPPSPPPPPIFMGGITGITHLIGKWLLIILAGGGCIKKLSHYVSCFIYWTLDKYYIYRYIYISNLFTWIYYDSYDSIFPIIIFL